MLPQKHLVIKMLLPNQVWEVEHQFPENTINLNDSQSKQHLDAQSQVPILRKTENHKFSAHIELETSHFQESSANKFSNQFHMFEESDPINKSEYPFQSNLSNQDEMTTSFQNDFIGEIRRKREIKAVAAGQNIEATQNLLENLGNSSSFMAKANESNCVQEENPILKEIDNAGEALKAGSRTNIVENQPVDRSNGMLANTKLNGQITKGAEELNKQQESPQAQEVSLNEDGQPFCRICFESEQNTEIGTLIQPCRCTGSMKWIHNECLKTWIVSKGLNIKLASCELCGTVFNMKFKYRMRFRPKTACKKNIFNIFSCVCLSLVIIGLISVIIFISARWGFSTDLGSSAAGNSLSFKLAIVVACGAISVILMILVIVTVRDAFFIHEISEWTILSPDLTKPRVVNNEDFLIRVDNSSPASNHERRNAPNQSGWNIEINGGRSPSQQNEIDSMRPEISHTHEGGNGGFIPSFQEIQENTENANLNNSRMSELMPVESVSRFIQQEHGASLNTSSQDLLQKEEERKGNKSFKARTLHKNYSASHSLKKVPIVFGDEGLGKVLRKEYSQSKLNNKKETVQHTPLSRNASDSRLLIKNGAVEANKSQENALKDKNRLDPPHVLLYQKLPKEFIKDNTQEKTKTIEIIIDHSGEKTLTKGGKSDNDLLKSNDLARNESGTRKITTQFRIDSTKGSLLRKIKSSTIVGPTYIIK